MTLGVGRTGLLGEKVVVVVSRLWNSVVAVWWLGVRCLGVAFGTGGVVDLLLVGCVS